MIYIFDDFNISEEECDRLKALCNDERKNKIDSYKYENDKKQCLFSYILLLYALKNEYNVNDSVEFEYEMYGKPYVSKMENICFNISHCKEAVVCAVDKEDVGVDVQNFGESIGEIVNYFIPADVRNKKMDEVELTREWTLKEAYGKYKGVGLGFDMTKELFNIYVGDGIWSDYNGVRVYTKKYNDYILSVFAKNKIDITKVSASDLKTLIG